MKRAIFVAASALSVLCSPWNAVLAQGARSTVRVGTTTAETLALALYAQEEGFFNQAGLNVDISLFANTSPIVGAVVGRSLDIGCTNFGAIIQAHIRNIPIAVMAPGAVYSSAVPTTVLVVDKKSLLRSPRDLNGKIVAINNLRDMQQATIMKMADTNGGDAGTIKFIELPAAEMRQAIVSGRVDAGLLIEPSLTYAKDDVRIIGKPYDAAAKRMMTTAFFATTEWLSENAATAATFAAAIVKTAIWSNKNPATTLPILERYSKLEHSVLLKMNRTQYAEKIDLVSIQPLIDLMADYRFLPARFLATDLLWSGKAS